MKYGIYRDYALLIRDLADKLSRKNILYVKIFQACALNNHFIDETMNNQLIKFTDQAPWALEDIDMDTLMRFETDYDLTILNAYRPINAGMISLVFQAELKDSKKIVILKMKRKNIEEQLNAGIANLLFFLRIINYVPFINNYGLPEIIQKNIDLLSKQTDFRTEVRNIQRFKKVCTGLKYIVIPEVYPNITVKYQNIILMEYIPGVTISKIEKKDYEIYAKRIMQFSYISILLHGIMHGDLHIGNILFLKNENDKHYPEKIGILDFGIIYEIGETRTVLFDIFTLLCSCPPEETAHKILQSGLIEPAEIIKQLPLEHYQAIICLLAGFINETVHIHKKIKQINFYHFLTELNRYIAQHKLETLILQPSADLLKIQVMFAMLHGAVLTLCEHKAYIDFADEVIRETFQLDLLEEEY